LLVVEETRHIDELVENSGLNSSKVLATLFDLEMKGVIRQLPGKQFNKVVLQLDLGVKIRLVNRRVRRAKSTRMRNLGIC
jgi:hypothetical protein